MPRFLLWYLLLWLDGFAHESSCFFFDVCQCVTEAVRDLLQRIALNYPRSILAPLQNADRGLVDVGLLRQRLDRQPRRSVLTNLSEHVPEVPA